jgi:hypothetical protein
MVDKKNMNLNLAHKQVYDFFNTPPQSLHRINDRANFGEMKKS